jgi:hypothetical protein
MLPAMFCVCRFNIAFPQPTFGSITQLRPLPPMFGGISPVHACLRHSMIVCTAQKQHFNTTVCQASGNNSSAWRYSQLLNSSWCHTTTACSPAT